MKLHFWQFYTFLSSSKIDFWPFFKWAKKWIWVKKKFRQIGLFDFTSFSLAWNFLNFLCHSTTTNKNDKNCTQHQQQQHKQHDEGHEEYNAKIRPCMFCNQSVSCDPDYLVCRENVCMLDDYEGNLLSVALKNAICFSVGWEKSLYI